MLMQALARSAVTFLLSVCSSASITLGIFHWSDMNDRTTVVQNTPLQVVPSSSPRVASTASPLDTQEQKKRTPLIPINSDASYDGAGYFINIPADFASGVPADSMFAVLGSPSRDTWHSPDETQTIGIDWEIDSANSRIRRLEETQLIYAQRAKTRPEMSQVLISHPNIPGAISSTMLQKPLAPAGSYALYLFVVGSNGNIYSVFGLSQTTSARASVRQIIGSFSLEPHTK